MPTFKYYDLRFTSSERFFFGSEVTFGQQSDDERRRSYLITSQALPQQTTLLGAIRYEILRLNGKLRSESSTLAEIQDAQDLVGNTGYEVGASQPQSWGEIAGISPLLLHDGNQFWHPVPIDDDTQNEKPLKWRQRAGRYWELQNFDPKQGLNTAFAPLGGVAKSVDDLFFSQPLVGNRISNRYYRDNEFSEADEEGLFRQTFMRNVTGAYQCARTQVQGEGTKNKELPDPSSFSFVLRIAVTGDPFAKAFTENHPFSYQTTAILGAEQGTFKLTISKVPANDEEGKDDESSDALPDFSNFLSPVSYLHNTDPLPGTKRIVLLSDAYLPEEIRSKCRSGTYFLVAKAKSFRFLSSQIDPPRSLASIPWYNPNGPQSQGGNNASTKTAPKPGRRTESKRYTLFERGGVLLVPEAEADTVAQAINGHQPFRSIGYNYCSIENNTST